MADKPQRGSDLPSKKELPAKEDVEELGAEPEEEEEAPESEEALEDLEPEELEEEEQAEEKERKGRGFRFPGRSKETEAEARRPLGSVREGHERVHIDDRFSALYVLFCAAILVIPLVLAWAGPLLPKSAAPTLPTLSVPTFNGPTPSGSASLSPSPTVAPTPTPAPSTAAPAAS